MRWTFLLVALIIYSLTADALLPELVLDQDDRKAVQVASFGFLTGGQLSLDLRDLVVTLQHSYSTTISTKVYVYASFPMIVIQANLHFMYERRDRH